MVNKNIFFLTLIFSFYLLSIFNLNAQKQMNCKVFFASNSYVPSIEEQNKLKSFLIFPDSIFIATIQLNGYSDDIGKNSYNDSLAARRIEEIKKTIISCHINPAIITKTLTKGEVELNVSARDSEKQRSANRRVDVIVELGSRVKKEIVVEKPPFCIVS